MMNHDGFNKCCGSRPRIQSGTYCGKNGHWAMCGICGKRLFKMSIFKLETYWNKGKVKR